MKCSLTTHMTNLWPLVRHFQIAQLQLLTPTPTVGNGVSARYASIKNNNQSILSPHPHEISLMEDVVQFHHWNSHGWSVLVGHCCLVTLFLLLPPLLLAVPPLFAEMVSTSVFPPFSSLHLFSAYSLHFSYSSLHPEFLWLALDSIDHGTPLAQGDGIFSTVRLILKFLF